MTNKKKIGLNMAFQSEENFLSFLKQEAQSTEFERKIKMVEKGSHPREDELYDYVLGDLDEERSQAITNHILFCKHCAKEASTIMRIESETDEELLEATEKPPLWKQVADSLRDVIISSMATPALALADTGISSEGQTEDGILHWTVAEGKEGSLIVRFGSHELVLEGMKLRLKAANWQREIVLTKVTKDQVGAQAIISRKERTQIEDAPLHIDVLKE